MFVMLRVDVVVMLVSMLVVMMLVLVSMIVIMILVSFVKRDDLSRFQVSKPRPGIV